MTLSIDVLLDVGRLARYTCTLAQLRKRTPTTPAQAAACCSPVDALLDPEFFRSLGDPTRAKLLACLIKCSRPCAVGEIAECCSVDLSVVSRHLRMLERAGILVSSKKGRSVTYTVSFEHLCRTLRELADAIGQCETRGPCGTPNQPTHRRNS